MNVGKRKQEGSRGEKRPNEQKQTNTRVREEYSEISDGKKNARMISERRLIMKMI